MILASFLLYAGEALAGPIEDLQPGHWYMVPNSRLDTMLPNPIPPGWSGPVSIMGAWSGGAYDTKRDRLIVWGGGHNDYGGNEIYVFDISAFKWLRTWGPSSNIPDPGGSCSETYSDGNPVSKHTYDGLEYIPIIDRFFSHGGSLYCGPGSGSVATWLFDFNSLTWQLKTTILPVGSWTELEVVTAYDSVTGHVFISSPSLGLYEYNPSNNTWTERSSTPIGYGKVAAIDPGRRKFVVIGGGQIQAYTLSASGTLTLQTLSTTGDAAILSADYPGFVYDPVSDRFVAWNGGANVYTLNMDTLKWTRVPPALTNTVVPTSASGTGTFGRWQYVSSKNAFIGVNQINENVYVYKLTAGGGPSADNTPPASPRGLVLR